MLNKQMQQDYGNDPLTVGESDKYQAKYLHAFVDNWDELNDWDGRAQADGATFHLNMFPLRKTYMERLMKEVGFQRVTTYGDFKETYRKSEPAFFIHVAEKKYLEKEAEKSMKVIRLS